MPIPQLPPQAYISTGQDYCSFPSCRSNDTEQQELIFSAIKSIIKRDDVVILVQQPLNSPDDPLVSAGWISWTVSIGTSGRAELAAMENECDYSSACRSTWPKL
jgi:hypothetical protein